MSELPRLLVEDVRFFERDVCMRMPFRFGIVTLTEAPQVFVRARIRLQDGTVVHGQAAELFAPKWFDKNPDLTNADNFEQLRNALAIASSAAKAEAGALTAFALHAATARATGEECGRRSLNGLIASFGCALIDRAILDGLCRAADISIFEAVRRNLPGIDARTTPDLAGFDLSAFLEGLAPAPSIAARHTVGLVDAITQADIESGAALDDGLPESLEAVVAAYGHRYFKLKVGGDMEGDIKRLRRIAAVLDTIPEPYFVSLDGNEQYADAAAALELVRRMGSEPALERLTDAILYVEQPIARARALDKPIGELAEHKPVAIDESDSAAGVFPKARALGYTGISSKSCKGFYRSILNRARVAMWNENDTREPYFMTAEDLTTQGGIAVQQDLALATLIGCTHVERNGHHYVDGMAGAPDDEQQRFLAAHPDLYRYDHGRVRLAIKEGRLSIGSLDVPGLGTDVEPDWVAMTECEYGV